MSKANFTAASQSRFDGGASKAVDPDILPENQVARMKNVLISDGRPRPRFGLREVCLLPSGKVQGATVFNSRSKIIVCINGQLFRIGLNGITSKVDKIKLPNRNSTVPDKCWFCETPSGLLIQDGHNDCLVYDGASSWRARPSEEEVPRGTAMAYGNGRLVVATNNGIRVGDIYVQSNANSELKFTEQTYWAGGGEIGMPGKPIGLAFVPLNDTSTGYGALMVTGDHWTSSVALNNTDRDSWQQTANFVTTVFSDIGCVSHESMVPINQDIWWVSNNSELRSLRYAALDNNSFGHTSQSKDVADLLAASSPRDVYNTSGIYFKDQLLMTARAYKNKNRGISYKSLLSLNFAPMSNMRTKATPAYNGEWEGLGFTALTKGYINGKERAFVVSTDKDGQNRLWEFTEDGYDLAYRGSTETQLEQNRIVWQVETRKLFHGSSDRLDHLKAMDIYLSKMKGEVDVEVYFRPDYAEGWFYWDTVSFNAKTSNYEYPMNLKLQGRSDVGMLAIPDAYENEAELKNASVGYGFQYKLVVTGSCQLDKIITRVKELPESIAADRDDVQTQEYAQEVEGNEFIYDLIGGPDNDFSGETGGYGYFLDEDGEPDGCYFVDENGVPFIWRDIYQPPVYRLLNINADTYLRSGTYENDDNSASSELTIWKRDDSSNDSNLLIYHIGGLPPSQEITTPLWLYMYGGTSKDCGTQTVAVITKPGNIISDYSDVKEVKEDFPVWIDGELYHDEWDYFTSHSSYRFLRMADLTFGRDGSNAWAKVCLTNAITDENGKLTVILDPETTEPAIYEGMNGTWDEAVKVVSLESSDTAHRPYITTTPPEQATRDNFWDNTALSNGCIHLFDFENPDRERWSYVRGDSNGLPGPYPTYINNLANASYPLTFGYRDIPYGVREFGGPNGNGCRGLLNGGDSGVYSTLDASKYPFGTTFTMASMTRVDGLFESQSKFSRAWSLGSAIAGPVGFIPSAATYGGTDVGYSWWLNSNPSNPNRVTGIDLRGKWILVCIEQAVTAIKIRLVIDGVVHTHSGTISSPTSSIHMPENYTVSGNRLGALRHGPLYIWDRANLSDADLITLWGGGYGMDNNLT